ncbi:hypothetical protein D3C72_1788410 [compost metagenome]
MGGVLEGVVGLNRDIDRRVFVGRDRVVVDVHNRPDGHVHHRSHQAAAAIGNRDHEAVVAVEITDGRIDVVSGSGIQRHRAVGRQGGHRVLERLAVRIQRLHTSSDRCVFRCRHAVLARGGVQHLAANPDIHQDGYIVDRGDVDRGRSGLGDATGRYGIGEAG